MRENGSKIRFEAFEGELYGFRRGAWKETIKKREEVGADGEDDPTSPASSFDDVDLTGRLLSCWQQSLAGRGSGFSTVLTSEISGFREVE